MVEMTAKTKDAIETIISKYKAWLRLRNPNSFKLIVQDRFGSRPECSLCDIHIITAEGECIKCPAKIKGVQCFDQNWFKEIRYMKFDDEMFDEKFVRKALKERIEFYEGKLK